MASTALATNHEDGVDNCFTKKGNKRCGRRLEQFFFIFFENENCLVVREDEGYHIVLISKVISLKLFLDHSRPQNFLGISKQTVFFYFPTRSLRFV